MSASRFLGWFAIAAALAALINVISRSIGLVWSKSVDSAHHYLLIHFIEAAGRVPNATDSSLGEMAYYPPASHLAAVWLGRMVGSSFYAMNILSQVAVAAGWAALAGMLGLLSWRARRISMGLLLIILLGASPAGPFTQQLFGMEIIGNFFYAQIVAQTLALLASFAVGAAIRAGLPFRRWSWPLGFSALLVAWFHLLPALELLSLLCVLTVYGIFLKPLRAAGEEREWGVRISTLAFSIIAFVLNPPFQASRHIAENNGALRVPPLDTPVRVTFAALVLAAVSIGLLIWGARERGRANVAQKDARVLVFLSGLGMAIALPAFMQMAMLQVGDGSEYAVKKYAFCILTVGVVQLCATVGLLTSRLWPASGAVPASATNLTVAMAIAVGTVSLISLASHPAASRVADVLASQQSLVTLTARLAPAADGRVAVAVSLPRSNPVNDYMINITQMGVPRGHNQNAVLLGVLGGGGIPANSLVSELVTEAGSPYDIVRCRRGSTENGLVVIDYDCTVSNEVECHPVNGLALGGSARNAQLTGFGSPESMGRWTIERTATFKCRATSALTDIHVLIRHLGTYPLGSTQRVIVQVKGGVEREYAVAGGDTAAGAALSVPIGSIEEGEMIEVSLTLPDSRSPAELGHSTDGRRLGIYVASVDFVTEAG